MNHQETGELCNNDEENFSECIDGDGRVVSSIRSVDELPTHCIGIHHQTFVSSSLPSKVQWYQ